MKISIVVPAFNEEKNLKQAVKGLCFFLEKEFSQRDYEILIINDGSTDNTGEIADNLAKPNFYIKAIHNKKNMGLGYSFRKGVELAAGEYLTWFPGDNENLLEPFIETLRHIGQADIIISYTANPEIRSLKRRFISRLYTSLNNFLFGLNLRYYNGLSIYKRDLLMKIPSWSNNFAFSVEILVFLLKSGVSFLEVPIQIKPTSKSSALKLKNIIKVVKAICFLYIEVRRRYKIK